MQYKNGSDALIEALRMKASDADSSHCFDPRFYYPHYQPIIDVPSGCVAGYESLARTFSPEGEVISAGWIFNSETVPAEQRLKIDRAVRLKSMHYFAARPEAGLLFVNISPDWVSRLTAGKEAPTIRMMRESGMNPRRVVVEITESFGDIASLSSVIDAYKQAGIKIAIDDFGVGGSQIDRLIALDPDYIKIDMGIFKDASRAGKSAKVLMALSALAEKSSCEIICEGVETEQEFHFALECGAQKVQGWLFGRANELLLPWDAPRAQLANHQISYLKRKKDRIKASAENGRKLQKYIRKIVDYYQSDQIHRLNTSLLQKAGVLRFFICDHEGQQISPNYNFTGAEVEIDPQSEGWFWSHRPYFPVLMALNEVTDREQVVSRSYTDAVSRQHCKTHGILLADNTIMLIDALATDEVLYCE